jgi:CO/xanthine dehydrogenase FAD-binding subunit
VRFHYHRPATLGEALELLAGAGLARRPIAYGSDLLVWTKTGTRRSDDVVDLTGIPDLLRIEEIDGDLVIGAGARLADLGRHPLVRERCPVLAKSVAVMGSVQLREGASLGGNVCTASPAGDTAPALLVSEARMLVTSTKGTRDVATHDFYTGPGTTVVGPGEVLTAVAIPRLPPGAVGTFRKGSRRAAVDLALVSVAGVAFPDAAAPSGVALRLALGAVAPTPVRAVPAEDLVRSAGLPESPDDELGCTFAAATRSAARPIDDVRATAAYRLELVGVLAARVAAELRAALEANR